MSKKVWGGRFRDDINELVDSFNSSIGFDRRLYPQDIEGTRAHCLMLAKQGLINDDEASQVTSALAEIKREMDRGEFPLEDDHEDIHSLIEKTLVERVGMLGEKIHTGRSRNDQVALDTRIFVRESITGITDLINDMQVTLIGLAENNFELILPGYTHLQPAQPVLLAHHLLAYFEMLKRDRSRFNNSLKRVNVMPLN